MKETKAHQLLPDTVLTIYCLKGLVSPEQGFPDGFIGNWEEEGCSFLFFVVPVDPFIENLIQDTDLTLVDRYTMTYGQWQGQATGPVTVGEFVLIPWWMAQSPFSDARTIRLDAGLVFGDGMHPTTRDCLAAMEMACANGRVASMLDLGTGSGVLALAGCKLGCTRVVAVDNNLLAARTARRNSELNSLENNIVVVHGRAEELTSSDTHLLVANIQYQVMREIVESDGFLKERCFILSGLQSSEAERIVRVVQDRGGLILERWTTGDVWQTVYGTISL